METRWSVARETAGNVEAEILAGLLEAQGIEVLLSQEAAGRLIYPVTFGALGTVQILVPETDLEKAMAILADFDAGSYQNVELEISDADAADFLDPDLIEPDDLTSEDDSQG